MYVISTNIIQNRAAFLKLLSLIDKLYDKVLPTLNEMATDTTEASR